MTTITTQLGDNGNYRISFDTNDFWAYRKLLEICREILDEMVEQPTLC